MIQNYNRYRILRLFFDSPAKGFQLREISRLVKLGMPSVSSHVKALEKGGFVKKVKNGVYKSYVANREEEKFKIYKRNDMLLRLQESGLVDFLADEFAPNAIVLFGSASRGDDVEDSDIDLLVIAKERKVNISKYEKVLKKNVSILFESSVKDIPKELMNNVINGIVLYGYLKVL